jgi:hypothetical protein
MWLRGQLWLRKVAGRHEQEGAKLEMMGNPTVVRGPDVGGAKFGFCVEVTFLERVSTHYFGNQFNIYCKTGSTCRW